MALHLISTTRLASRLAAEAIGPREQAQYIVVTALVWLFASYLPLILPAWTNRPYGPLEPWSFGPFGLWLYELVLLVIINVLGVFYCLVRCRVDPKRNFVIDFTCLLAPITVTTMVVVWGLFHGFTVATWWFQKQPFDVQPGWVKPFYSFRFVDLMYFLATVAASSVIFFRVGSQMERVSSARQSANYRSQGDAPQAARA
jgi:hypothetical protein